MTPEIALVLGILIVSMILFISEILPMDVVSLMVLCTLALTGLVGPAEALAGFSNPAVVTVWAMFILSGGLTATGVANVIGRQVLRLAGKGQARMIFVIMVTSGVLSAFMNNIGVAALLLPVVMDIARRTETPPSKLLMPLAYGCLLGGLTTLIGTPPNLLVSQALKTRGYEAFSLFDFTPVGGIAMLGGVLFIAFLGRHLLPVKDTERGHKAKNVPNLREQYSLNEQMVVMRVRPESILVGLNLLESRLGSAAGLTVYAVIRGSRTMLAPDPGTVLKAEDRLLVGGKLDRFHELRGWQEFAFEKGEAGLQSIVSSTIGLGEVRLSAASSLSGKSLIEIDFRRRFGVNVLAIRRGDHLIRTNLGGIPLSPGDRLLIQGDRETLDALPGQEAFDGLVMVSKEELTDFYHLQDWTFVVQVPPDSVLVGETLAESRLGDAFGLQLLAVLREDRALLVPDPNERLLANDRLLVKGRREDLEIWRGLRELEIEREATPYLGVLESEEGGMVEVVLSPRSNLAGKTPRELNFREKYGLQVVAVWREGRVHQDNLRDMQLRLGDGLLLLGPPVKFRELGRDPDFLVLTEAAQAPPNTKKGPLAAVLMAAVLIPVLFGWLPISISAVCGATLMVLTRCMTMEDAYRSIEWRPIFLISGMLPLGVAMTETGAANFVAEHVVAIAGPLGPWGVILGLYLITTFATTVVPTAALVVLMAPIVIKTSTEMGIPPHTVMMAVAMAASASFTSPISHPANVLVMGPGGYRFVDYLKLGVPLTAVVMVVVMLVLPIFWPI